MGTLSIKEEQIIWVTLMVSIVIHGLLFVFSGRSFIPHAQFSVQPSDQMVEVSIEEIGNPRNSLQKEIPAVHAGDMPIEVPQKIVRAPERINRDQKKVVQSISGVKVRANPDYFQNPAPEYPRLAKQMHQEGLVMLSVDVNKQGDPVSVEIIQSSDFRLLDQAALEVVRHWKFQPASIGNIPIESTVTVPIRFRLEK